ncbi:hypothetical protein EDC04DRAFT_259637 [Pisolithus marmoratus]|nr:hypothetical protein EDC04DRAFT_259637 [Pisolithus marmoratus]
MDHLAGGELTEKHITTAILAVQDDTLAPIVKFTTTVDSRSGIPTLGYLVEVNGELHPEAAKAPLTLHNELRRLNEDFDPQRIQIPTIRVLEPGTFGKYRQWKVEVINSGGRQARVPVLMSENAARERVLVWVRKELIVDPNGRVMQG